MFIWIVTMNDGTVHEFRQDSDPTTHPSFHGRVYSVTLAMDPNPPDLVGV